MAQPLYRRNSPSRIKENTRHIRREERKPVMPGPFIYVSGGTGGVSSLATWQSPEWENNWDFIEDVGFRHGVDGLTEFTGVVDAAGATSGTVAFTMPVPWHPSIEFSFLTDLDLGGGSFSAARVVVATNGQVTIYFPIS